MPRIYDSGNDPLDFCKICFPTEAIAGKRYGDVGKTGEGPDGRGNCFAYGAEHPDYADEGYQCRKCRQLLTAEDN